MSAEFPALPEPIELLDLEHGNSIVLRVDKYDRGSIVIHPKQVTPRHVRIYMDQRGLAEPPAANVPISIEIPALRVTGERLDEVSPIHYWDITSKTLQADLLPRLYASQGYPLKVTLIAHGYKPTKRYSVTVG